MAELFKFRCYQCQKLIGAPPSKFGKIVKCPKCGVDLVVPSPDTEPEPEPDLDPDVFRPEDLGIRLEPEPLVKPAVVPPGPLEPVGPDPIAFLSHLEETGEPPAGPESSNGQQPEAPEATEPPPLENPEIPEPEVEPLVSRKKTRTAAQLAVQLPRARDVVLPRTAAVAWALFALLGLAFAFLAGLLLGQRLGK